MTRVAENRSDRSLPASARITGAIVLGLVFGAVTWIIALWGVHAYHAPILQWLLVFPAALFGPVGLVVHAGQWIGYAFLVIAIRRQTNSARYALVLAGLLVVHVVAGILTVRAV